MGKVDGSSFYFLCLNVEEKKIRFGIYSKISLNRFKFSKKFAFSVIEACEFLKGISIFSSSFFLRINRDFYICIW